MNQSSELFRRHRLQQISVELQSCGSEDCGFLRIRGQHDNPGAALRLVGMVAQLFHKLNSTHRQHIDVAQHEIRTKHRKRGKRGGTICSFLDDEAADHPEHQPHRRAHEAFVVDNEYAQTWQIAHGTGSWLAAANRLISLDVRSNVAAISLARPRSRSCVAWGAAPSKVRASIPIRIAPAES